MKLKLIMTLTVNLTHQILAPQSVISIGYFGQKPPQRDYPENLVPSRYGSIETTLEKSKRYAWTLLPVLTLVPPIGTAVHVLSEAARTSQIANLILKSRDLKTASYHAFRGLLSLSAVGATIFERSLSSSILGRRLSLGIKLLTIAHEICVAMHRMHQLGNKQDAQSKFNKLFFHILNNIFCLIALIFKNPWTTAVFLGMQGVAGFFHADRQADKGKDLKGLIHLGFFFLRFIQAAYILNQHLSPKTEKPEPFSLSFEELREARRQLLIAPSETLKT